MGAMEDIISKGNRLVMECRQAFGEHVTSHRADRSDVLWKRPPNSVDLPETRLLLSIKSELVDVERAQSEPFRDSSAREGALPYDPGEGIVARQ
ncbi:hypothetical protein V6N11_065297 [Hibiscus sabdariffa]|uniref:Uncharacterized protein n=1 Tax=Hibiscus sabdariffa TaxID=183260 RepID=A0ABR2QGI9_9ROSI